jgi:hypothetical protein
MERWDFDCQKCGGFIGNNRYVYAEWYQCSHEKQKNELLERVYPRTQFSVLDTVALEDSSIPKEIAEEIKSRIRDNLQDIGKCIMSGCVSIGSDLITEVYWDKSEVVWHLNSKTDEYSKKAGIIPHEIKGRGWGRLGYCFHAWCAKEVKLRCDVCGSPLELVLAEDHPGGQWGIIDRVGNIIREPAPMT